MEKAIQLQGFARVKIAEDGKIVGDSGWVKNTITDYGLDECIGQLIVGGAGSKRVSAIALGEGTAPATDDGTATTVSPVRPALMPCFRARVTCWRTRTCATRD